MSEMSKAFPVSGRAVRPAAAEDAKRHAQPDSANIAASKASAEQTQPTEGTGGACASIASDAGDVMF